MNHDTTLLFGLPGVRVRHVENHESGTRIVHVETAEESVAGCPSCGVLSTALKGNVTTTPRDIPYGEAKLAIVWHKRRWRCAEPACPRGSFTESVAEVPPKRRTTGRLRRAIAGAVGDGWRGVAESAVSFDVSWPTAHAAVSEAADAVLIELEPTAVLGIDETRRGRPRWTQDSESGRWVRTDPWDTGFVDLAGYQGLLGPMPLS